MSKATRNSARLANRGAEAIPAVPIHDAQRETGLPKDTLRVWERRYGFPQPARDPNGERLYSRAEIARLQLLKRLVDHGMRPGAIIHLPLEGLRRKLAELGAQSAAAASEESVAPFLAAIKRHDAVGLHAALNAEMHRQGLELFIVATVAPLTRAVGASWSAGDFEIFEEHLYSETIQSILRNAIAALGVRDRGPRVLLTTPPGEEHALGLLMVHALVALEGASTVPLGIQTPARDIVSAVRAHRADIVGLSISEAYAPADTRRLIAELDAGLDAHVQIWVGGAGARALAEPVARLKPIATLAEIRLALQAWRSAHA